MAFWGKKLVWNKICLGNSTLEQVNSFKYLRYTLSSLTESGIQLKIQNYDRALRIINQVYKTTEVQNHTKMKACIKFWQDQQSLEHQ